LLEWCAPTLTYDTVSPQAEFSHASAGYRQPDSKLQEPKRHFFFDENGITGKIEKEGRREWAAQKRRDAFEGTFPDPSA
jgi:hypothetical protein